MARYTGFTKNAIINTSEFSRFGSPSKDQNGVVVPGQWTFMAVVNGQAVNFKAPYANLREFNGLKLMYRDEMINNQQADWFQLMDGAGSKAEIEAKAAAVAALANVAW